MTKPKPVIPEVFEVIETAVKKTNAKHFLREWIVYNLCGWFLAISLTLVSLNLIFDIAFTFEDEGLVFLFSTEQTEEIKALLLWVGALFGEILAIAQWLVLRRYLPQAQGWILVTSWGWILGSLVGPSLLQAEPSNFWMAIAGISPLLNFTISLTQCLFIKRYAKRWQEWLWWLPLTMINMWLFTFASVVGFMGFWGGFILFIFIFLVSRPQGNGDRIVSTLLRILEHIGLILLGSFFIISLALALVLAFLGIDFNETNLTFWSIYFFTLSIAVFQIISPGFLLIFFWRDRWR